MTDTRTVCFLDSLLAPNPDYLNEIEKEALGERIPLIRKSMQGFMRTLLCMKRPRRILEIGTAVGFSALFMAEYTGEGTAIVTIENYEKRVIKARQNFERFDKGGRIELMFMDAYLALDELCARGDSFDFVFMDAAKGQYQGFFEPVMKLLDRDGILLCDNVLQDGDVMESRFALTRRDRTIHRRMREFLFNINNDPRLSTSVLPVGDGAALCVRI
jgi:predicted O-methyltransferase YrrM